MQTQKQRSFGSKKPETTPGREIRSSSGGEEQTGRSDVFMQEDDVAYWLHYPVDDINPLETYLYNDNNNNNNDLLSPVSTPFTVSPTCLPPPPPPPPPVILPYRKITAGSRTSRVSDKLVGGGGGGGELAGREIETCEMSVTSSPGSSGCSGGSRGSMDDWKRKRGGGDTTDDNAEFQNEDVGIRYPDLKKQSNGRSTSTKKLRSAEIHNLSEKGWTKMTVDEGGDERRRDRINEKMKTLQELIPRCNKSDKASILDEAIEYLKSLQMQVQMMYMGCGMVPMMFLGARQYMPNMAMSMGMNHAMFPYPVIPPGPSLPNPSAAAHLSQRFPVPGFNMTPVTVAGPTASLSATMMSSLTPNGHNQPQVPTFADLFQQYHGPQNQGAMGPNCK